MNLRQSLRDFSFPLEEEDAFQINKSRFSIKEDSRKYGQIKLIRKQRHRKKMPVQARSWKQFKASDGLKALKNKKDQSQVLKPTVAPREDLVNLGRTILRSRKKLMFSEPPSKKPTKPKSLFKEKNFKDLGKDLRTIFCS